MLFMYPCMPLAKLLYTIKAPEADGLHIVYYIAISLVPKFDEPCAVAEAPVLMSFALLNPGCPMKFNNELAIDNYQILRLNRNHHGGSVVMYIHSLSYQVCQLEPKILSGYCVCLYIIW